MNVIKIFVMSNLFISYITLTTLLTAVYYYTSSSKPTKSNQSNQSDHVIYDIKRFDKKRPSGWELFKHFLECHYEFTFSMVLRELADGVGLSPVTLRQYVYFAREAGWVEIRAKVRRGKRLVTIYRSKLYKTG